MKTVLWAIFGMTVLIGVTACVDFGANVYGSGTPASETRTLESFDRVVVSTAADVRITAGETIKCEITGDDNIVPLIVTEVIDGELRVRAMDTFRSKTPLKIVLEVPMVTKVTLKGSGGAELENVTKETLDLGVYGSGSVTAKGSVGKLTAHVYGSGNTRLDQLEAGAAEVNIKGSGNSHVWVNGESLDVSIAGSGNVTARGKVDSLKAGSYGSGDLRMGELETKTAEVKCSGSGGAELWVTQKMDVTMRGSGDVRYKGDPVEINKSLMGSGGVVKVD